MTQIETQVYRNRDSGNYLKRLKTEPVYCPINSRGLGLSLGINPIQGGFGCNYDCSCCQCGIDDVEKIIRDGKRLRFTELREIDGALKKRLHFNDYYSITICSSTEPLLHPRFDTIVDLTIELRDSLAWLK